MAAAADLKVVAALEPKGAAAALEQARGNDDGLRHSWLWQQRQRGSLNPRTAA